MFSPFRTRSHTGSFESLRVTLLPSRRERRSARVPTENVEAYKAYSDGSPVLPQTLPPELRDSEADVPVGHPAGSSLHARAWAGVADCDSFLYPWGTTGPPRGSTTSPGGQRQGFLNSKADLAEAHALSGPGPLHRGSARRSRSRVQDRHRTRPKLLRGTLFLREERGSPRAKQNEQLITSGELSKIMPYHFEAPIFLMQLYSDLGRNDEALKVGRLGFERAEQELSVRPENVRAAYLGAAYLAYIGEKETLDVDGSSVPLPSNPRISCTQYNAACSLSRLGDIDEAIDLLEKALPQAHAEILGAGRQHDSDLDPLRDSPRFAALLKSIGA